MGDPCHSCPICEVDDASLCRLNKDVLNTSELVRAATSHQKTTYCPNHCFLKGDLHAKSPQIRSAALAGLPQHCLQGGRVATGKTQHHPMSVVPQSAESKSRLSIECLAPALSAAPQQEGYKDKFQPKVA